MRLIPTGRGGRRPTGAFKFNFKFNFNFNFNFNFKFKVVGSPPTLAQRRFKRTSFGILRF